MKIFMHVSAIVWNTQNETQKNIFNPLIALIKIIRLTCANL